MDWKNIEEVKAFVKTHMDTTGEITHVLSKRRLTQEEGEALLMFITGMSAGLRQKPILGEFARPLAVGWEFAVILA